MSSVNSTDYSDPMGQASLNKGQYEMDKLQRAINANPNGEEAHTAQAALGANATNADITKFTNLINSYGADYGNASATAASPHPKGVIAQGTDTNLKIDTSSGKGASTGPIQNSGGLPAQFQSLVGDNSSASAGETNAGAAAAATGTGAAAAGTGAAATGTGAAAAGTGAAATGTGAAAANSGSGAAAPPADTGSAAAGSGLPAAPQHTIGAGQASGNSGPSQEQLKSLLQQ